MSFFILQNPVKNVSHFSNVSREGNRRFSIFHSVKVSLTVCSFYIYYINYTLLLSVIGCYFPHKLLDFILLFNFGFINAYLVKHLYPSNYICIILRVILIPIILHYQLKIKQFRLAYMQTG